MPSGCNRLSLAALLVLAGSAPAAAQKQRFKLVGGGGLTFNQDPDRDLRRAGTLGGTVGVRFGDHFSLEGGFAYARTTREFTADGSPVDENTPVTAERSALQRTDYSFEGTLLVNLGRRSQFHPFLLGGGGWVRQVDRSTPLAAPGTPVTSQSVVELRPLVHVGVGFDLYLLYNVSARAEARFIFPEFERERRALRFYFGGSYYF